MNLIVGLGNPGKEYEFTRHNLGFLVVRRLAEELKVNFSLSSFTNGLTVEGIDGKEPFCLLLPLTYMNNSGAAVKEVVIQKKIDYNKILVICDDLSLPYQQLRIRSKGADGGHNGLASIIQRLESKDFVRLKMGIDRPSQKSDVIDYVLQEFTKQERKYLDEFVNEATQCCLSWMRNGINKSMELYNRRKENE